jgi:PAS domain S-box-containing protein
MAPDVLDAASAVIVSIDATGAIASWNRAAALRLFGNADEDLRGRSFTAIATGDSARALADAIAHCICSGEETQVEVTFERTYLVSLARSESVVIASALDISDLAQRAERVRVSLQSAPLIAFNQDRELRYTWVYNPAPPVMASELLGKTDYELLRPGDAAPIIELKRTVLTTGVGARGVVRVTGGGPPRFYDLTVEPLRDAADQVIGITCVAWDISELQKAEQRQLFLVEAGAVLLGSRLDLDAMVMHVARLAVRDLADVCSVEVIDADQPRRIYVAAADTVSADLVARFRQLELAPPDVGAATHDADIAEGLRDLGVQSLLSIPLRLRGEILGAFRFMSLHPARRYRELDVELGRDFARLAALAIENAQLHGAAQQALASRDEVIGIVAHDLRNPINAVLLNLDVIDAFTDNAEQQAASLHTIRSTVVRMNRLVQDMLDIARIEAGTFTVSRGAIALDGLIDEVLAIQQPAATEASLRLRSRLTHPFPSIVGDHGRLLQVFDNLVSNAIKFTPAGGTITIGSKPEGGDLVLWVADTGSGMSSEQLASVFDRFWQATRKDRRGAGLGLSIVKGIVESLGGRVWVESEPGSGSTFYFTVPRVP